MECLKANGELGGAVVRALASHQCGPGSNPSINTICGLSLLLVLSLAPRGFSPGTLVFPSPQKPTFPNSNSTRNQIDEETLCGCTTCKSLFIYYFIYLFIQNSCKNLLLMEDNQALRWKILVDKHQPQLHPPHHHLN